MIIKGLIDDNYKIFNKHILNSVQVPSDNEVLSTHDNCLEENMLSSLVSLVVSFSGSAQTPDINFGENRNDTLPSIGTETLRNTLRNVKPAIP